MAVSTLIPSADLAPSVTSRVLLVRAVDFTEGAPATGSITFELPWDVDVKADGVILKAGKQTLDFDANGEMRIRVPTADPDTNPDAWFLVVKKSWAPHPYAIRVPMGTSTINLVDVPLVEQLPANAAPGFFLTGASVTTTEGAQWGAAVDVAAGIANFRLTVPPGGVAWYRGVLATGTELNSLVGSLTNGIYVLGTSSTYGNAPFAGGGKLTVETTTTGATEHRALQYGTGVVWRRYVTNYYSNPITWSPWRVDSWDKGRLPNGTDIDTLTNAGDNGLHRVVDAFHRSQLTGTWPKTPNGLTLTTPCSVEVIGAGTGTAMHRISAPGLAQFTWTRSQGAGGVWQEWRRLLTDADVIAPTPGGSASDVGVTHLMRREAFTRRRGGSIGTGGKAAVALRFDDSTNGMLDTLVPLLRQHAMPATLVTCSKPFTTGDLIPLNDRGSWDLVKGWAMQDGVEVWHHGGNHQDASGTAALTREIVTSAADLRALLPELAIEGWAQPGVNGTNYDGAAALSTPAMFYGTEAGRLILQEHAVSSGHRPGRVRPLLADGQVGIFHRSIDEYTALQEVQNTLIPAAQDIGGGVVVMLHPGNLGKAGVNTTVAQLGAFLAWLAGERDAGRVEILTMSGIAVADSRRPDRLNLLGNVAFARGWTTTGWTVTGGVATNTSTAALSKTVLAEQVDWAYGAVHELRVKAEGTGTVRLTLTSGSWVATRDFPVSGTATLRLHAVLPVGATATVARVAVPTGTGVKVSEPSLHAA